MISKRLPVLAVSALLGCTSESADDAPRHFVGRVDGTDAFVGVVLGDDALFAYVCDGTPATTTISSWFVGTTLSASNPSGSSLDAAREGDGLEGKYVSPDGDSHPVTAEAAISPSGLYFGELHGPPEIWGGWIVIGAEQRGAVVDRGTGDIVGSPSIDPAASSVDVEGEPLDYEEVAEPIGEELDEVPPG